MESMIKAHWGLLALAEPVSRSSPFCGREDRGIGRQPSHQNFIQLPYLHTAVHFQLPKVPAGLLKAQMLAEVAAVGLQIAKVAAGHLLPKVAWLHR